jgi:WD40 repeat protein
VLPRLGNRATVVGVSRAGGAKVAYDETRSGVAFRTESQMSPPYDSSVFHSISRRAWDRKHARYPKASSNWCVAKLRLTNQLEKHAGCVNSVAWNDDASLLLTGSDDLFVCVWSVGSDFPCRGSIYTGHVHNIFRQVFPNYHIPPP